MRTRKKSQLIVTVSLILSATIFIFCSHPEAQDISNWKTYTNEEYGYELKYPPDLTIKYLDAVLTDSVLFMRDSKICLKIGVAPIPPNGKVMYKGKMRSQTTFSLKDHIVSGMWGFCKDIRDKNISNEKVMELIKWKPIKIGDSEGIQAYGSDNECINKYLPISIITIDNVRYRFSVFEGSASEYNKILSTFRFIK